jgi:osmoprotectant transport system permease protein
MSDTTLTSTTGEPAEEHGRRGFGLRLYTTPIVIALVVGAIIGWIASRDLDSIERRSLTAANLWHATWRHIELTAVSTVLVLAIAVPLGIVLTRRWARWASPLFLALANIGQATPVIGVLVLLALVFGVGFQVALAGIVAYSVLPVLRNTMTGLQGVDRSLIEAGRGIGMSAPAVLFKVELPLAVPLVLAGIRTALVLNVGVATVATFVSAGGLGNLIVTGITLQRTRVLVVGAALTVALALFVDWLGAVAERLLQPKGL